MIRSSAIRAKDPITAEVLFYQWQEKYPGNKTGDPRAWVKNLKVVKDGEGIYHMEYEPVNVVVKAAGLANETDCNGCVAWDAKKDDCADGARPGTCEHKPQLKHAKAQPVYKFVDAEQNQTRPATHPNLGLDGYQNNKPPIKNCQPDNSEIEVNRIFITKWNPRTHFDQDKLKELAQDIEKNGLLQPVLVRRKGEKSYELVIGERRLRAFREILKRETIPALIKDLTDEQVVLAMLSENLQREDLNPIEEANGLKRALEMGKMTHEGLASSIGMSREWVTNRIRLLEAPEELQGMIVSRETSVHNVLTLLAVKDHPKFSEVMSIVRESIKDKETLKATTLEAIIKDLTKPEIPVSEGLINDDLPKDVVAFLKEGMITAGATIEIEALDPFPAVYIEVLRTCKERVELKKKPVTEEMAKDTIRGVIIDDEHADRSLNLEEPPPEFQEKWKFFGKSECNQCPSVGHIRYPDEEPGDREFCINKECYSQKLAKAQAALEEKEAKPKADSYEESYEKKEPEATELPTELPKTTQKCHVLSCTEQTLPDSHWCEEHQTKASRERLEEGHRWNCRVSSGFCYSWGASKDELEDIRAMIRHLFVEGTGGSPKAHEDALHRVLRCIREGGDTWGLLQKLFSKEA